jgi:type II secretory pathway component PulJ
VGGKHKRERDWHGYTPRSLVIALLIVAILSFLYMRFGHTYLN